MAASAGLAEAEDGNAIRATTNIPRLRINLLIIGSNAPRKSSTFESLRYRTNERSSDNIQLDCGRTRTVSAAVAVYVDRQGLNEEEIRGRPPFEHRIAVLMDTGAVSIG